MENEYDFWEELEKSQTPEVDARVRKILPVIFAEKNCIVKEIIKNEVDGNDGGIDYRVIYNNSKVANIDIKNRDWNFSATKDLTFELLSVVESNKIGWSLDRTKQTDLILWLYNDFYHICYFPKLVKVFTANKNKWVDEFSQNIRTQFTKSYGGYKSKSIFIPFDIWQAEYKKAI